MFDLIGFRNWLMGQLHQFTDMMIVPNDDKPRPAKPFLAYSITSPYIPQAAPPVIEYSDVVVEGQNLSRKQRTEYPTVTFSFTAVADTMQECYDVALKVFRWFSLEGHALLKERDVIVARLHPVQDRSLGLGERSETQFEYRVGFDAALRAHSTISMDIETIEIINTRKT